MWKFLEGAVQLVVNFGRDLRELQAKVTANHAEHREFARSTEAKLQAHHDAIQRLAFEAQRDRENAARDRADATRERELLFLRLENERLRALLPPSTAPELPPGA